MSTKDMTPEELEALANKLERMGMQSTAKHLWALSPRDRLIWAESPIAPQKEKEDLPYTLEES